MSDISRRKLLDIGLAVLLGGGAFVLYTFTLAPSLLAGDGGEFQFAPYLLGIAHPTGYPLYTILGWVWSHLLPSGDPAYRLNLFSAFWAALAVGLLYPTARALLRQARPPASMEKNPSPLAALTTAIFAVTPTLWSQAIIAEVYGLHIFFVVLLFYLVLKWEASRNHRFLLAAALAFGLGLAHHRTTLLLAPALLAYVGLTDRRVFRDWRRVALPALLLVLAPLLLYLYIPLRAPHTPYLRQPLTAGRELVLYENSVANFVSFVTGGPFGGAVDLAVDLGERLAMTWRFLQAEIPWPGLILALVGVVHLALRRRRALLALTGLAYVVAVAFNLVYTIGDIFVLYIPSYLVVTLWIGVGASALLGIGRFSRSKFRAQSGPQSASEPLDCGPAGASLDLPKLRIWETPAVARATLVLALFALPLWMLTAHYADLDQSQNTQARSGWEAILAEPLPPDAVLVSDDRNDIMPLWYLQYVEGARPDLLGLFPLITPDYPTLGYVLDLALSTGRPVYLVKEMPGVEVKVNVEREGRLWRVLGPAAGEPGYRLDARLDDAVALVGHDRAPHNPQPGETLQVSLYWQTLRPLEREYHSFVHLLDAEGRKIAQSDRQPGGVYYPTTLWRPGERLRDDHTLAIPADTPPGVYQLLVGLYAFAPDGTLEPLGKPLNAGEIKIEE